jgi:hypothetical protein
VTFWSSATAGQGWYVQGVHRAVTSRSQPFALRLPWLAKASVGGLSRPGTPPYTVAVVFSIGSFTAAAVRPGAGLGEGCALNTRGGIGVAELPSS